VGRRRGPGPLPAIPTSPQKDVFAGLIPEIPPCRDPLEFNRYFSLNWANGPFPPGRPPPKDWPDFRRSSSQTQKRFYGMQMEFELPYPLQSSMRIVLKREFALEYEV
jgi:hypothetical protein